MNWRIILLVFVICLGFSILNLVFAKDSLAQSLGLSISPPIDEIMIIPGKSVTRSFTITNDGSDGSASLYLVPFRSQGETGGVFLDEENAVTNSSPYFSWFKIISPAVNFGEKFYMAGGQSQTITLKITPSPEASEKDYYFTLLYRLDNDVPGGFLPVGPTNQARIGANLLISLSKDGSPKKVFEIAEFSAPKIIDSLGKLKFMIRVGNNGSYVFKSNGQITIDPTFGSSETLELTPFNVIADSTRNISCLSGEDIVPCQSDKKVFLGIYKSTLLLTPDGSENSQKKTSTTVALPFSLILAATIIIAIYKILISPKNKAKDVLDNSFHAPNNIE